MNSKRRSTINISVDRTIYEYVKKLYEEHEAELRLRRIKNVSDLWEEAVLYYVHNVLKLKPKSGGERGNSS